MNEFAILNINGVECFGKYGTVYLKLETVARGMGFTQENNGVEYVKQERVNGYLEELGFFPQVGKTDTFSSKLSNKFDKYPKNFLTAHRIASRNYNRLKQEYDNAVFERRRDESLELRYGDYMFLYPKTIQDIKDEAVQ